MDVAFWDNRYASADGYVFGTGPNDWLKEVSCRLPPGPVLCLGEGEGRNAVYLASLGHNVTAVDQSAAGLSKARRLASTRNVEIRTEVADLSRYVIAPGAWSVIVSIFVHLPPPLRRRVHASAVQGLVPGGWFVLEAYTPRQLRYDTGGPKQEELLMTLPLLREELDGLDFVEAAEIERDVVEGGGHSGRAAVVHVAASRPMLSR